VHYPQAEKLVFVMDNLNTHTPFSLYSTFAPPRAPRILKKLEIHYTPVRGSWLNMAEIELSALARQYLSRRIGRRRNWSARSWPGNTIAMRRPPLSIGALPLPMCASNSSGFTPRLSHESVHRKRTMLQIPVDRVVKLAQKSKREPLMTNQHPFKWLQPNVMS
jgi:DDE superfamily endonuclease